MTRVLSWLWVFVIFGALIGVVYQALRACAAGRGMPEYSVFSDDRNGLGPAAQPLRKLGWEPIALTQPVQFSSQREAKRCLLILAEPVLASWLPGRNSDLPEADVEGMLRWVERGNTLLYCGTEMTELHRALNLAVEHDTRVAEDATTHAALGEAGGYTEGIDDIVVEGRDVLHGGGNLPLWWLDNDPGAVVIGRGTGRVIVVADPSILTLRGLRRGDNVRFLVNVASLHAGDGRVYFDEFHHGLRSGGGFWGYLRVTGQQWTVLVILLVAGMAAWSVAVRLGRAAPTTDNQQADAVEYASAVARIYQQAGVQHLLAESLCRDFLDALTSHLRLRRSVLPAEILAAWRQQHPQDTSQELERLLRSVTALRGKAPARAELLSWTINFDRFKTEVLRAG